MIVYYSIQFSENNQEINLEPLPSSGSTSNPPTLKAIFDVFLKHKTFTISDTSIRRWEQIKYNISQKKMGLIGLVFKFMFWLRGGDGKIALIDRYITLSQQAKKLNTDSNNSIGLIEFQPTDKISAKDSKESMFKKLIDEPINKVCTSLCTESAFTTYVGYKLDNKDGPSIIASFRVNPINSKTTANFMIRPNRYSKEVISHEEIVKTIPSCCQEFNFIPEVE